MSGLPPVFIEFLGSATGFHATARGVKTELASVEAQGGGNMAKLGAVSKAALLGIGVAAGVAAVKTVHMAADFQTQMTRVRTGAGELQQNMGMVSQGLLTMAGQVGKSTEELTSGLYMVESAGFHGADALNVLRVSAQGAKVGAAELAPVTDAVTTALNAYKLGAGDVTHVMNALVATEASGKTNMEALAGSMSSILPVAASAHVGLNEVLGAMATMTSQGTSAKVAATYLRQTIGQLSNPTAKAANEMKSLGLNAYGVSKNLGTKGLAATLTMLTDAITKHMGPGGDVLIDKLKSASRNTSDFQKVLANLSPTQQTYIGALATMVGGTKSMMAALQLTGPHMATFQKNIQTINEHVKDGGKEVEGWSDVQKTFNQRMAEAKGSLQAIGIEIGTALLPTATRMVDIFARSVTFMTKHKTAAYALAIAIGSVLAVGLAVAAAAAWNFAAAMWATGIPEIVLGVVALIAVIAYLALNWKTVAAWLSSAWSATVKGLVAAWHWLADETMMVWNNYIVAPLKTAWQAIKSVALAGYHAMVDPLVAGWRRFASITSTVWNAISGFFRKWWPLLVIIFTPYIALFIGLWNHFHTALFSAAKVAWAAIAAFLAVIWGAIKTAAGIAWTAIRIVIVDPVVSAAKQLYSWGKTLAGWLSAIWRGIYGTASSIWGSIKAAMTGPINAAKKTISGLGSDIKRIISQDFHDAYNAVANVGSWFYSIGSSIVEGVVSGISGAIPHLLSSVGNMANSALSKAKSVLGINSPSKVFAKIVGSAIPEGVAKGVIDNAHIAQRAVAGFSAGLTASPSGSAFGSSVSLSTSGAGGGTVVHHHTVNVTIQGSVMADTDLASTIQRVMARHGARNSSTYQAYKR